MKDALKFLFGSSVTYVVMAACSATSNAPAGLVGSQQPEASGTGGSAEPGSLGPDDAGAAVVAVGGIPSHGSGGSTGGAHAGAFGMIMDPVPPAMAEPATDGTRLKAVFQVGADGSKQFAYSWWDSERKEECAFTQFSDGVSRCVPSGGASGIFFLDAGCSTPLFFASGQCQNLHYGLTGQVIACSTVSYSGIQALTPVSPAHVFQGSPTSCSEAPQTSIATYVFFTGSPIALSSFAAATRQHG